MRGLLYTSYFFAHFVKFLQSGPRDVHCRSRQSLQLCCSKNGSQTIPRFLIQFLLGIAKVRRQPKSVIEPLLEVPWSQFLPILVVIGQNVVNVFSNAGNEVLADTSVARDLASPDPLPV